MKDKKNIALVLSSGGAKGIAHIGAIEELQRQGYNITSVSGSSIGAVIGGLLAMGRLEDYTHWIKTLDRKSVWGLMDFSFTSNGLLKGERVFDRMKEFIPDIDIEEMTLPFTAVASDILNEKEIVFDKGSFYRAARASIAIPAMFTPVKYDGTFLVDGGILNPIPIEHVRRRDNDLLVVVNLYGEKQPKAELVDESQKEKEKHGRGLFAAFSNLVATGDKKSLGYISLLTISSAAMIHKLAKMNIDRFKPDLVIDIPADSASTFDFHRSDELLKLGLMQLQKPFMPKLRKLDEAGL
ncbi:patatin-like phospholipase family protein [Marinilabilia salmonicolor]|uniref:patatin-like phospholipase family protein n=1 Tax=Marinilabilia salmonicolor TaxID=989 RepID=UPI000468F4D4|nr:patatin-like phospholipase family protein [Marinilabilia salmonicolor]